MEGHDILRAIAEMQYSVVARWQAQAAGLNGHAVERAVTRGHYEMATTRVLRVRGAARSVRQQVMVDLLDAGPGASLSHVTALGWWGVPGFSLLPVHVSQLRTGARQREPRAIVHPLRGLDAEWVTSFRGAAIVRPELALYQVCGMVHPLRAERGVDNTWSRGLTSGPSMRLALTQLRRRGRNGTRTFEKLLDARPDDYIPPASNLESRFQTVCRNAGLPDMRRQVNVGAELWIGCVDFVAVDLPLIIEVQSELYHRALSDERADEKRFAALRVAGFTVVPVWDSAVWTDPSSVVRAVRDGCRRARRRAA